MSRDRNRDGEDTARDRSRIARAGLCKIDNETECDQRIFSKFSRVSRARARGGAISEKFRLAFLATSRDNGEAPWWDSRVREGLIIIRDSAVSREARSKNTRGR